MTNARSLESSFVPPAELGGEGGRDEDLVDRRVEADPGEAMGEGPRVFREQPRPVGVLEIADPTGNSEVAQVGDNRYVLRVQGGESFVGEAPIVFGGTGMNREVGGP